MSKNLLIALKRMAIMESSLILKSLNRQSLAVIIRDKMSHKQITLNKTKSDTLQSKVDFMSSYDIL